MRKILIQVYSVQRSRWIDFKTFPDEAAAMRFYDNLKEKPRFRVVERYEHVLT